MQPVGLQEWIHKLEEGEGTKYIRLAFLVLALLGITALWHIREAKNFATAEAMDAAQLARNLAQGHGFTTKNIQPFSIALLESHRGKESTETLKQSFPDISNAPLYPTLLAGLMKVLPFKWDIESKNFWRYQPERIIGGFNQALFFISLFLTFLITAKLFERVVASMATILMALTEVYWEFVTSGLSTNLLIVLFLGLFWWLIRLEELAREELPNKTKLIGCAVAAGLLAGLMGLTRYSMIWLLIPLAAFIAVVGRGVRTSATPAFVLMAVIVLAPWLVRNYQVSGTLFGTAGFVIHQDTTVFPGHILERSMPRNIGFELNKLDLQEYPRKLFLNAESILMNDLPQSAGNWIAGLFLGALFMPFNSLALRRLKWLALGIFATMLLVQALGHTQTSLDVPRYNSENLMVVFSPLFFILGAGFLFVLLDQIEFPIVWLRSVTIGVVVLVLGAPLILRFFPPRTYPFVDPYFPPTIQIVSHWLQPNELMMTDMPWATAWYGDRKSVWMTLDYGARNTDDFYRIHDEHEAIQGLYLTQMTTDQKFLAWKQREGIWGKFYLDATVRLNLPSGFPLKIGPPVLLPEQLFLSDRIRWRQ